MSFYVHSTHNVASMGPAGEETAAYVTDAFPRRCFEVNL